MIKKSAYQTGFSIVLFLISFIAISVLPLRAYSYTRQNLKDTRVSIAFFDESLHTALKKLEKKSKVQFAYNSNDLHGFRVTPGNYENAVLGAVLEQLLRKTDLTVKEVSNTLVIYKAPRSKQSIEARDAALPADQITPDRLQLTISGIVSDKSGPLPGVSVQVKGTTRGTTTDAEGKYILKAVPEKAALVFSLLGYSTVEEPVNGRTQINIALRPSLEALDEVVVVGYGTQKKADITGAIGTVDIDEALQSRPVTNVQELLAGTVPGLNVSKSTGAVGSGASLNIRGTSTIGGSSGVLVLIDGIPGNIYTLNPNDIESISVLKDAASAAIYGSRAANGVLLITTKTGKSNQKPVLEIQTSVGLQNPQFMLDFVGAEDFMKLWDQALINDGKEPLYGQTGLQDLRNGKYANNKWYIDIYKRNTLISNNYLSISGKKDFITYRLSGSYDYQDGTLPNNNYKKYTFRPNMTIAVTENLSVAANVQYTETYINEPSGGTTIWQTQAARAAPISPVYTNDGLFGAGSSMAGNPIAGLYQGGYSKSRHKELMAIFDLRYSPLENLNIKGTFARYAHDNWGTDRVSTYNLYDNEGNIARQENLVTSLNESTGSNYRNTLQLTSDYTRSFRGHTLKLLAGYSQEYFNTRQFSASRDRLPFDDISVLDVGSRENMQNAGATSDVAIQSLFGRLNYDYEGRYLFQANIRADGSSRFSPGYRWGYFPSFSAGWNVLEESFMDKVSWLSELKIRGSWGILGDAEKVGYYATSQILSYSPSVYGFNGAVVPGAWNGVAVNPNISWEEARQANFGLDMGFFNHKLTLSADYFINNRDKILYAAPVPHEFGLGAPLSNLLKMQNKGVEFLVGYRDSRRDFSWGADVNLSFSKNTVSDLSGTGPWIGSSTFTEVGHQFNLPYGLEATGLFESQEEVNSSADQGPNVFAGNIRYKDQNSDGVINGEDRVVLNDRVPLRFGGNLQVGWKNFDFSANVYGALNTYRYISGYEGWAFFLTQNARPMHLNAWLETNKDASYPRLTIQYTANDTKYSGYWLRKADYLKLQNMQLGYTFPAQLLHEAKVQSLRLYVSVQNLATITGYDGFDPEGGYYPLSRTVSFGVNLKF